MHRDPQKNTEEQEKQEMMDILQGADIVKFIKSPPAPVRWCGRVVRTQNQRMLKQIARATMKGTRKTGRRRKM